MDRRPRSPVLRRHPGSRPDILRSPQPAAVRQRPGSMDRSRQPGADTWRFLASAPCPRLSGSRSAEA